MRFGRQGKFTFGKSVLLIAGVAIGLMSPSLATAEESNIFANFSKCPTGAPEMNDPARTPPFFGCFSALMRSGAIKVGNIGLPISSLVHIQFATAGVVDEDGFFDVVPNGTSLDAAPLFIPNFFAGLSQPPTPAPPTPSVAPVKKHHKKKHHKKHPKKSRHKKKRYGSHHKAAQSGGKPGNRRIVAFSRARASGAAEPLIAISMELAGDVRNFNFPSALGLKPGIGFEIPVRLHLQGDGLGPNCFIGSPSQPIVIGPEEASTKEPMLTLDSSSEFLITLATVKGFRYEDARLTIPGASGCGPSGALDGQLNALAGLPAPAGTSEVLFDDTLFEAAFAESAEDGLFGGARLQAAFDAAAN